MNYSYDHERFAAKNKSLAAAEELNRKDEMLEKKGYSHHEADKEASCFNCKMKQGCTEFKAKRKGGAVGVVSFGGDESFVCKKFIPAEAQGKSMSNKQVKSLLKNIRKGY